MLSETEIKKALECCSSRAANAECVDCPLFTAHTTTCIETMASNALELIKLYETQLHN